MRNIGFMKKLSSATHRSKSFHAREAIERYLEDMEDLYLAKKAYEEYLKDKSKSKNIKDIIFENGISSSWTNLF